MARLTGVSVEVKRAASGPSPASTAWTSVSEPDTRLTSTLMPVWLVKLSSISFFRMIAWSRPEEAPVVTMSAVLIQTRMVSVVSPISVEPVTVVLEPVKEFRNIKNRYHSC